MKTLLRPTWIEVDKAALINNVQQVRRLIGLQRPLMAVVKANAYGHGAVDTANVMLAAGAHCLAVATPIEGIELRQAGIQVPILVLGYTPTWLAQEAVYYQLTTTVYDREIVHALDQAAAGQVATSQAPVSHAKVHVKVDTGLNRLGLTPAQAPAFMETLQRFDHVQVEGIFTHFATSDMADKSFAHEQFGRFAALLSALMARGLRPPVAHAANSAALLTMPETHLDLVRAGIALYGLHPDADDTRLPNNFRPALRWKTQVAQVRHIEAGESVSYGREFIAPQPMIIAILPVGYADGFPRRPFHWGSVLLHGRPAPILGRVCMDQTIIDVTAMVAADGAVQQGDEVMLIGGQGAAALSADEVATRLGTNNYDVVSRILARVPRLMVDAF